MLEIQLKSNDGEIFNVSTKVAKLSDMLRELIIDDLNEEELLYPITLMNINGHILRKVIEWAENHTFDVNAYKLEPEEGDIFMPEWDKKFLNLDDETLKELLHAANYLRIPLLRRYCINIFYQQICGKSSQQMRERFNIDTKNSSLSSETQSYDATPSTSGARNRNVAASASETQDKTTSTHDL